MVPFKYNLRSLRARKVGSLMTIFGVGMVVWASIFAFGLSAGLDKTLEIAAGPLDVIVMRKGSTSEAVSAVSDEVARDIIALPGIATNRDGRPLAATELVIFGYLPRRGQTQKVNVAVRGVLPVSRELRDGMQIVEGRDFRPGVREAIVSRAMSERFQGLGLGEEFEVRGGMFRVVGLFEAGGGAVESEIWTDQSVLAQLTNRTGAMSCVQFRAASKTDQERLINRIKADEQIDLNAMTEEQYYAEQAQQSMLIKIVGGMVAFFLTIGAMFAVANTMYGAIASRAREIGTLRALGFGRFSILLAFLLESLILCTLGAVLGCLGALALGDIRTGTMNAGTFTEVVFAFNFGPSVLLSGALLAVAMGLIGGLMPAIRAVRMRVVNALREV
ncbi:MAG: ABC transporter permease [Pirellulales bacterium]|nr:ABC transporter permease [Pirellulales bacterium]